MMGKLASLKMVAQDLGAKAGVIGAPPDPALDALVARCAAARRRADARRAAADKCAHAARALAEAAEALQAEVRAGEADVPANDRRAVVAADPDAEAAASVAAARALAVVARVAGGVGREAEAYAGSARRGAELELGGAGERVDGLRARKAAADAARARAARAARRGQGGSVGEGRAELEALRAAADRELQAYVAERDVAAAEFTRVHAGVAAAARDARDALRDGLAAAVHEGVEHVARAGAGSVGALSVDGAAARAAGARLDWLALADDLRLATYLKYADAAVVEMLPSCRYVHPAVLPRSTLRCMTLRAPCEGTVDGPVFHWAGDGEADCEADIEGDDESAGDRGGSGSSRGISSSSGTWVQYVVAKGTNMRNLKHVLLDLSVGLVRDDSIGCSLHRGFYDAGSELAAHAAERLDRALPVRVVGHSMGGAAAAVAALLLHRDGFSIQGVHLYGTPRFTDQDGAALLERIFGAALLRVAHYDDVVRTLPPPGRARYRHAGRLVLLHADDSVWALDESPDAEPTHGVASGSRGFAAHRTSFYTAAVARQVARALGEHEPVHATAAAAVAAEAAATDAIAKFVARRDGVPERYDKPAPPSSRRSAEAAEGPLALPAPESESAHRYAGVSPGENLANRSSSSD